MCDSLGDRDQFDMEKLSAASAMPEAHVGLGRPCLVLSGYFHRGTLLFALHPLYGTGTE